MANTQSAHILKVTTSPKGISKHNAGDGSPTVTVSQSVEWTPATGDTLELMRLPVNAVVHSIKVASDDLASTSITADLGLYENSVGTAAGTVIDLDCYADGIDFDGVTAVAEYRYSALGIETYGDAVYTNGSLTEAQALELGSVTLAVTCAAATSTGVTGTVAYEVTYSAG